MKEHIGPSKWAAILLPLLSISALCLSLVVLFNPLPTSHPITTAKAVSDIRNTSNYVQAPKAPASTIISTPFPTIPPPAAENVPIYPGAKNINNENVYATDWRRTRYETDATQEEVIAFIRPSLQRAVGFL